jgi:hypothetical protein
MRREMLKFRRGGVGILLVFAVASHAVPADDFPAKMFTKLHRLAGKDALDCGGAGIWQPTAIVNDCALRAFRNRQPFYVLCSLQGIDTREVMGFAGDRVGNVYKVFRGVNCFHKTIALEPNAHSPSTYPWKSA